jgi:hypothetical protein
LGKGVVGYECLLAITLSRKQETQQHTDVELQGWRYSVLPTTVELLLLSQVKTLTALGD